MTGECGRASSHGRQDTAIRRSAAETPCHAQRFRKPGASALVRELLNRPAVAVQILEDVKPSPGKVLNRAGSEAVIGQCDTRCLDVGDQELKIWRRAGGASWRQHASGGSLAQAFFTLWIAVH